jgi:hypothetical protein
LSIEEKKQKEEEKKMIENVNMSSLRGMMPPQWGGDNKLTDQQKTQAQEIISKYDPENMTEEDKKSLMDELDLIRKGLKNRVP